MLSRCLQMPPATLYLDDLKFIHDLLKDSLKRVEVFAEVEPYKLDSASLEDLTAKVNGPITHLRIYGYAEECSDATTIEVEFSSISSHVISDDTNESHGLQAKIAERIDLRRRWGFPGANSEKRGLLAGAIGLALTLLGFGLLISGRASVAGFSGGNTTQRLPVSSLWAPFSAFVIALTRQLPHCPTVLPKLMEKDSRPTW